MALFPISDVPGPAPDEAAVVSAFLAAVNDGSLAELVGLFADDAHVNDQLRNFWGLGAISAWLGEEIVGEAVRLSVQRVRKHYDVLIVTALMHGNFEAAMPDVPLVVDFYFTVADGRIVRLQLLISREDVPEPEIRKRC